MDFIVLSGNLVVVKWPEFNLIVVCGKTIDSEINTLCFTTKRGSQLVNNFIKS